MGRQTRRRFLLHHELLSGVGARSIRAAAAVLWLSGAAAAEALVSTAPVQGQAHGGFLYRRPGPLTFAKRLPGDLADFGKGLFKRKALGGWVAVAATTGVLIAADEWLLARSWELGDRLGISHASGQKTYSAVKTRWGDLKFQAPHDSGSALYFLGDGIVHLTLAGGFLTYGAAGSDHRALQTASQIAESVIASGAVVQVLKHVTGRESPFVATAKGGRWRFFPSQRDYHEHVPHYDAFPAGHVAASVATLTVISRNYPERRWIRPLGWGLITLLGFQMMNNKVHWASDYPVGVALGLGFGGMAVDKGRAPVAAGARPRLVPLAAGGAAGAAVQLPF